MLGAITSTLLALIIFVTIFAVAFRAYRQGANRAAIAIPTPPGVQLDRFVPIGGIAQWISIRGADAHNPVLLFLHGGPGMALSGLAYARFRPFEQHFTVVQWDQRGAGKTYGRHGKAGAGEMTIERMVEDGIELAEWLRVEFGRRKIILLGMSWGSVLGTEMAARRPDLFSAYVGAGQVVEMRRGEAVSYASLMERLKARSNARAIARLEAVGPPPYASRKALFTQRRILSASNSALDKATMSAMPMALLLSPMLRLKDVWDTLAANAFTLGPLYEPLMAYDIRRVGTRFKIPMIYIQGADDIQTPTALVEEYFQEIDAPRKSLRLLEGGGHMAVATHVPAFLEALVEAVG
jgi:proline iminopeptidase